MAARRWRAELEADALLIVEMLLCLSLWGPQIAGWLSLGGWVGARVDVTGTAAATVCAGVIISAAATLSLARRADDARIRRRAEAGRKPAEDVLAATVVGLTIVTGAAVAIWFLFVEGPGPLVFGS